MSHPWKRTCDKKDKKKKEGINNKKRKTRSMGTKTGNKPASRRHRTVSISPTHTLSLYLAHSTIPLLLLPSSSCLSSFLRYASVLHAKTSTTPPNICGSEPLCQAQTRVARRQQQRRPKKKKKTRLLVPIVFFATSVVPTLSFPLPFVVSSNEPVIDKKRKNVLHDRDLFVRACEKKSAVVLIKSTGFLC